MNNRILVSALIIVFLIQMIPGIQANSAPTALAVITVPGDYPYISWAVANATDGDVILVDAGLYGGVEPYPIILNKSISIIGVNGTPEIVSLPDVPIPINSTPPAPLLPAQAPNITIENLIINISSPSPNITALIYIDAAGVYEVSLRNLTLLANQTTLPNLAYTIYILNSTGVEISNIYDEMPGAFTIEDSITAFLYNITRIQTYQLFIDNTWAVQLHDYYMRDSLSGGLFVRDSVLLDIDGCFFQNISISGQSVMLIYPISANDYRISIKNITFIDNEWLTRYRTYDLLIATGSTPVNSLYLLLDNITFIDTRPYSEMIAYRISTYSSNNNTYTWISNISVIGYFKWMGPFSYMNNLTINNMLVDVELLSVGPMSGVYMSSNVSINNLIINKSGFYIEKSDVSINRLVMNNGTIYLEDSHVIINEPQLYRSTTTPFIDADNSTLELYGVIPIDGIIYNMSIGPDALNTTYQLYMITPQDVPVKPPATVIVSPLINLNTSYAFNVSFELKYNDTMLLDNGIKEHLLNILKHDGSSWIKPAMTMFERDMNNNTLRFTIANIGDPIIVLYSYPIVVGGELSPVPDALEAFLPLGILLLITGVYILFRWTRYN